MCPDTNTSLKSSMLYGCGTCQFHVQWNIQPAARLLYVSILTYFFYFAPDLQISTT
jgi:hypothetical protein